MLNDKIALVTGATRGIGRAIALELGTLGATVIGTATSADGAGKISAYLAEAGIKGQGHLSGRLRCGPDRRRAWRTGQGIWRDHDAGQQRRHHP